MTTTASDTEAVFNSLVEDLRSQIPEPPTASDLMSSPVRTIRPDTTIEQAQRILFRYGHSGLSVVEATGKLVGVISRRDLDLALHHGFSHAPVKGYMTKRVQVISPDTSLSDIETLMVNNDIGRLPVIEKGQLIGIVTRTDVLRHIHQTRLNSYSSQSEDNLPQISCLLPSFQQHLHPPIWKLLQQAALYAQNQGWKAGNYKKLNLPFENKLLGQSAEIKNRMAKRVEEFVYNMLVNVLNTEDTAPLALAAILKAGSYDAGPKGHRLEDPAQWTPEQIIKRGASINSDKGPEGDFDD